MRRFPSPRSLNNAALILHDMMQNLFQKTGAPSWLVVFLGNPGAEYVNTRHNAGFLAAEQCERDCGARILRARFRALTAQVSLAGDSVLLLKPQTFMNLSGDAVAEAMHFYKSLPPERVIVVSDDVALPPGRLRIRTKGSAGGHNGLKSIIARLGTEGFPRVRIGVGAPPHPDYDMADWVLGTLRGADLDAVTAAAARAWDAVKSYISEGADKTMSRFNAQS